VIWDDPLRRARRRAELEQQGISGVAVPNSDFLVTPDLASQRSDAGAAGGGCRVRRGGTPTGLHGTGIVSVTVLPANEQPPREHRDSRPRRRADLAFRVAIQNSGDSQEVGIKVTLTIQKSPEPITQTKTIQLINSGETKSVTFENLGQPPFGADDAGQGRRGAGAGRGEHEEQHGRVPGRVLPASLA
jgi:hypothetical protein